MRLVRMTKIVFSFIASAVVASSSAFAADMACCASKTGKMECSEIYGKLKLTPDQKTKLDSFQQRCEKDGCTEKSMNKFMAEAREVLSPEQYNQLKAECSKMEKRAPKAGS
jgi:Spy/CpxP family protein refolding chaperone